MGISTLVCLTLLLGQVAGIQIGQGKAFEIENAVHRINYGVIFKAHHGHILTNEFWRQTFEIKLPNYPNLYKAKGECVSLSTSSCAKLTQFLSNIHRMQIDTKVELNHTLSYIQNAQTR